MERCLLVLDIEVVLRTITLDILATLPCKIRMASVTIDSVSRDNVLFADHTDSFPEVNCSLHFEEGQTELLSNIDLERFMDDNDGFSIDLSPSSDLRETALDADSSYKYLSCYSSSNSETLDFVSDATSPNSSKDLLPSDTADNGETSLSTFVSDVHFSDTVHESSCDTVTEGRHEEKCPSKGTPGTSSCLSPSTDDLSTIKFNEMDIEDAGFKSVTNVFSYTSFILGSKLMSLITRQHLRETISARSPTFPGEGSSGNSLKAQKPNEVDKVRREKKKKLNRDWARRDRTKRQSREKELKLTISRLDQENKKLEMELRLLREDLVIFQNLWHTHQVFYHE